ncbi:MAG: CRTAC1 family protein, partial [Candidatus Dormibacteria bacterium]
PRWRATGFGTVFGDFDRDGALDIAVANGGVRMPQREPTKDVDASDAFWGQYAERSQLFANDGAGRFRDISEGDPFCTPLAVARGLAVADFNNDGALDLLVTRVAGPARLYRNVADKRGHWLMVRTLDPSLGGRDAYGAQVVIQAAGKRWKRSIDPAYSYLCSNDPRAHFGLGQAGHVDAIQVIWPDGVKESFDGCAADQAIVLHKGVGPAIGK